MANTNAPFGFRYVRRIDGSPPNYGTEWRVMAYNTAAVYTGDVMTQISTGYTGPATAGTQQILGIAIEFQWLSVSTGTLVTRPYWPGSDSAVGNDVMVNIVTDPLAVFQAQAGQGGGTTPFIAFSDIGANINFNAGAGGNTSNGQSGQYLDQNTINPATTTLPFRIIGLVPSPNSDPTSNYDIAEVIFNNQDYKVLTGI